MASPEVKYEELWYELGSALSEANAAGTGSAARAIRGRLHKVRQEIRSGGNSSGSQHGVPQLRQKVADIRLALADLQDSEVQRAVITGGDAGSDFTLTYSGQTTSALDK